MKKLTTIAAALLLALSAHAQQKPHTWSITPKIGLTASNFNDDWSAGYQYLVAEPIHTNIDEISVGDPTSEAGSARYIGNKTKLSFTVGADLQYQFNKVFGLVFGVAYSQQGCKYDIQGWLNDPQKYEQGWDDGGYGIYNKSKYHVNLKSQSVSYNTIDLPVVANFYVWRGLALKVGLEPQIAVKRSVNTDATLEGVPEGYLSAIEGQTDKMTPVNVAVPLGISYEAGHLIVDARFRVGAVNMHSDVQDTWIGMSDSRSVNLNTATLTVGWKL